MRSHYVSAMIHDPGDFPRGDGIARDHVADEHRPFAPAKPADTMSDEELSTYLETLPPPPGRHLTEEEEEAELARRDAEAEADITAGRVVPHEQVADWLKTWGTPYHEPMPREWLE